MTYWPKTASSLKLRYFSYGVYIPVDGQVAFLRHFRSVGSLAMVLPGEERGMRVVGDRGMVAGGACAVPPSSGKTTHEWGVRFKWTIPAILITILNACKYKTLLYHFCIMISKYDQPSRLPLMIENSKQKNPNTLVIFSLKYIPVRLQYLKEKLTILQNAVFYYVRGRTRTRDHVRFPGGHWHGVGISGVTAPQALNELCRRHTAPDQVLLALLLLNFERKSRPQDSLEVNDDHEMTWKMLSKQNLQNISSNACLWSVS